MIMFVRWKCETPKKIRNVTSFSLRTLPDTIRFETGDVVTEEGSGVTRVSSKRHHYAVYSCLTEIQGEVNQVRRKHRKTEPGLGDDTIEWRPRRFHAYEEQNRK